MNWQIEDGIMSLVYDYNSNCSNLVEYQQKKNISFLYVWLIFEQVSHEIAYLHNNDIVHGDICPENLIVVEVEGETVYN